MPVISERGRRSPIKAWQIGQLLQIVYDLYVSLREARRWMLFVAWSWSFHAHYKFIRETGGPELQKTLRESRTPTPARA